MIIQDPDKLYKLLSEAEKNWKKDSGAEYKKIQMIIAKNNNLYYKQLGNSEMNFKKDGGAEYNRLMKMKDKFEEGGIMNIDDDDTVYVEVDMSYDNKKEAAAVWKKFNLKVEELKGGQGTEHDVEGKKKDVLAYLRSEYYQMDDEDIKEIYPELFEEGGNVSYNNKSVEQVWNNWTITQRKHFLNDHHDENLNIVNIAKLAKKTFNELQINYASIIQSIQNHIKEGQYMLGGGVGTMNLEQLLDKVPVFERMNIDGYGEYTKSKIAYDNFNNKTSNKHLSFEEKRQYDNLRKRMTMYKEKYKQSVITYINKNNSSSNYPLPNFNHESPKDFDDSNVNYQDWANTDEDDDDDDETPVGEGFKFGKMTTGGLVGTETTLAFYGDKLKYIDYKNKTFKPIYFYEKLSRAKQYMEDEQESHNKNYEHIILPYKNNRGTAYVIYRAVDKFTTGSGIKTNKELSDMYSQMAMNIEEEMASDKGGETSGMNYEKLAKLQKEKDKYTALSIKYDTKKKMTTGGGVGQNETEKIEVGTFVRYKKHNDFTGGKILSIKGSNVEIHNWDGSTIELPLKDLEYVKSWNESMNTGGKIVDKYKYHTIVFYKGENVAMLFSSNNYGEFAPNKGKYTTSEKYTNLTNDQVEKLLPEFMKQYSLTATSDQFKYILGMKSKMKPGGSIYTGNIAKISLPAYVKLASDKTFEHGGNGQNLLDNTMELAQFIEDNIVGRQGSPHEEDGFYNQNTRTLFKQLVDSMSNDDIENNKVTMKPGGVVGKSIKKKFLLYTNPNNTTNRGYIAIGDDVKDVLSDSKKYSDSYIILYKGSGTNEDLEKAKSMFSNYNFSSNETIMKPGGIIKKKDDKVKEVLNALNKQNIEFPEDTKIEQKTNSSSEKAKLMSQKVDELFDEIDMETLNKFSVDDLKDIIWEIVNNSNEKIPKANLGLALMAAEQLQKKSGEVKNNIEAPPPKWQRYN